MQFAKWLGIVLLLVSIKSVAQSPALVLQKGHFKKINSINFNKDGRQVVTTGEDGIIKIWDAYNNKLLNELGGNGIISYNAVFTANNKYIITTSGQIQFNHAVWSTETNKLVYSSPENFVNTRLSPTGKFAANYPNKVSQDTSSGRSAGYITDAPISIYSTATGQLFRTVTRFEDTTSGKESFIEFLSDSTMLVGCNIVMAKGSLYITRYHLYNFTSDIELGSFNDTSKVLKTGILTLSPGRKFFLRFDYDEQFTSADATGFTELWNIEQHKMIWHNPVRLRSYSFSDNDSTVLLLDAAEIKPDRPIVRRIFRMSTSDTLHKQRVKGDYAGDVLVCNSSDGNLFAISNIEIHNNDLPIPHKDTSFRINIWDSSFALKSTIQYRVPITAMSFNLDGKYLMTGYENGNFSLWDPRDSIAKEITSSENFIDPIVSVHPGREKLTFITNSMYGFRDEQVISKMAFFETGSHSLNSVNYLNKDKYSVLNFIGSYSTAGKFILVDNSKPSLISTFPYENNGGDILEFYGNSNRTDFTTWYKKVMKLQYPGLESFSFYSKLVSYVNPVRHMTQPDISLTYGVLKSNKGKDTTLLYASLGSVPYNDQLKGYIFTYDIPYLIHKSKLDLITTFIPRSNHIFLSAPVISNDGKYLLARDGLSNDTAIVTIDKFYYCQDLKANYIFKTPVIFESDSLGMVSQFVISPDKTTACLLSDASFALGSYFIRIINVRNGNPIHNLKINNGGAITGVAYSGDGKFIYSWSEGGVCTKWDIGKGKEIYTLVFFEDHDYAIILPDGYYYISSRTDAKYLNFKLANRLYNFSQFDLQFNRPDKVLAAIGSKDIKLMDEYYKAWQGRVKKSGFKESDFTGGPLHVPEINLQTDNILPYSTEQQISLSFTVTDSLFNIRSYNIFINDVPMKGINGAIVKQNAHMLNISEKLLLNEGNNKIEVNCTNEKGIESRKETLYINYRGHTIKKPKTYFIGIGVNQYSAHSSFVDLSYCVKDIRDLSAAFKHKFKEELVVDTLMNDNASRENILALKQKLMQTNVDDKVIVSFSGHGMVDPQHPGDFYFVTGSTDVNDPAANGVSYAQLEELLDSIPARKKIMLLDACHSGESNDNAAAISSHIPGTKRGDDNKNKAGSIEILDVVENTDPAHSSATDIFKLMKEAFVDIRRNNGAYVLSAAQSNELAGEGGGTSNGWFSSCLIEQLKQNNSMSVNELSKKVNQCVSSKSGGNQNTDNRQELAEYNWQLW